MKHLKKAAAALLAAALAATLCACGQAPAQETPENTETVTEGRTITDALGREVALPETVEKIIPLGNTPRMISYLGLAEKVVGYSGMDPEKVTPLVAYAYVNRELWAEAPIVGTDAAGNTSYYPEQMILAAPDVILCTATSGEADEIQRKTGIPVVAVSQGTLFGEDFEQSLRIIGEVCGVSERAEEVIAYINDSLAELKELASAVPEDEKPTALPAAATFKGSHGIEGIRMNDPVMLSVDAKNVADDGSGVKSSVIIDKEQVIAWDPEYIFLDSGGVALVRQDYAERPDYYALLKAYNERHIYQYPSSTAYYDNMEISLANCYFVGSVLYPEAFAGIDVEAKANEIFKFFLGAEDYLSVLESIDSGYCEVVLG